MISRSLFFNNFAPRCRSFDLLGCAHRGPSGWLGLAPFSSSAVQKSGAGEVQRSTKYRLPEVRPPWENREVPELREEIDPEDQETLHKFDSMRFDAIIEKMKKRIGDNSPVLDMPRDLPHPAPITKLTAEHEHIIQSQLHERNPAHIARDGRPDIYAYDTPNDPSPHLYENNVSTVRKRFFTRTPFDELEILQKKLDLSPAWKLRPVSQLESLRELPSSCPPTMQALYRPFLFFSNETQQFFKSEFTQAMKEMEYSPLSCESYPSGFLMWLGDVSRGALCDADFAFAEELDRIFESNRYPPGYDDVMKEPMESFFQELMTEVKKRHPYPRNPSDRQSRPTSGPSR